MQTRVTPHIHAPAAAVPTLGRTLYAETSAVSRGRQPQRNANFPVFSHREKTVGTAAGLEPSTSGRHCLKCGLELELISVNAVHPDKHLPPLLFLHGAMHGAWCFAENFLPYFAGKGYNAHALSLRGHGESDYIAENAGSFSEHMDDIVSVIRSLQKAPVLVAHSLGGILAQRYLADRAMGRDMPDVAGVAFIAVPAISATLRPSLDWFKELKGFAHGLKIIWWMSAMPKRSKQLVQELFFSTDIPQHSFLSYHQKIMQQRSILPVNGRELSDYNAILDRFVPKLRRQRVPVLVLAAGMDMLLMRCQVEALGQMLGCQVASIPGVGHDVMLDTRWRNAAESLDGWVRTLPTASE